MTLPASIASPRSQRGLTLVELMVALVMGMVLLAGVATVFVANKQSYRLQDSLARLQENGRFAIEFLERDIRMAGYTGCKNLVLKKNTISDPPGSNTCSTQGMTLDGGEPVDGFNNVGVSPVPSNPLSTTPGWPAAIAPSCWACSTSLWMSGKPGPGASHSCGWG